MNVQGKSTYHEVHARSLADPEGFWAEAAREIDLGPYAGWTEPERIVFQVERAYREFRGEPWDAPLDVTTLFRAMHEYRTSRRTHG